jgi:predicted NAD/FAD-dependent oxidoreductase
MRRLRQALRLAQKVGAGLGAGEALLGALQARQGTRAQTGECMTRIAIIGAGMAGLTLAKKLHAAGEVTVFEKSRGLGGRMATRQAPPFSFDHGAQYFTVHGPAFRAFLDQYIQAGIVQPWNGRAVTIDAASGQIEDAQRDLGFVPVPRMTSLAKAMADGLDVRLETEISRIEYRESGWWLTAKSGKAGGPFDWVVSTAPAPQTRMMMGWGFSGGGALQDVKMTGCFALMAGFDPPLALSFDAATVTNSPISWIAVNSSKPGREEAYSLLAQSSNAWAGANLEDDPAGVRARLLEALYAILGNGTPAPAFVSLHRWRFADTPLPLGQPFLLDAPAGLAACGDWCLSGRVESAFLSAGALADELLPLLWHPR